MANPLQFKVQNVDPKHELQKRLDAAPIEHAEALLVGYDILQTAHENGLLDLLNGLVGGRDIIAEKLAHYAKMPGGIALMRNAIAGAKIVMALDPDTLDELSKAVTTATGEHRAETKPPSLFTIAKRAMSEDSRRALSFLTLLLGALGKSLRAAPETAHK
jgi:uncharacterized protein YjgD (DUF1641 family)